MNLLKKSSFLLPAVFSHNTRTKLVSHVIRNYCNSPSKLFFEKSLNQVVLMGRVGVSPQLRGTDERPVVVFTLATNINYRYESGDFVQKTDWHRITVFKPHLRDIVSQYLKKGSRVYVEGRIMYGEYNDSKGNTQQTTSIVANDVIFIGTASMKGEESEAVEEKEAIEGKELA